MTIDEIVDDLSRNNCCHAVDFRDLIHYRPQDESDFKRHWDRLVLDENYKHYTRRERRLLLYRFRVGQPLEIDRNTEFVPTAVYDVDYTRGVNRLTYAEDSFIESPILSQLLAADIRILGDRLMPDRHYTIDIHLFRILSEDGAVSPTTSGNHQDGLDWVFMHFIDSLNIEPVISEIHAAKESKMPLFAKALNGFLETVIVNDRVLYHSANPVRQASHDQLAYRDMLLVSFSENQ